MTLQRRTILNACVAGASLACLLGGPAAHAEDFPARPITITVGYGAGDNMDLMVRMLAGKAEKTLGQPIVVLNKPGAAGAVALTGLVKEKPDGYQLAAVLDTALARLPVLRRMGYRMDEFAPVLQFATGVTGVVVKSSSPWKTLPELVNQARSQPGSVTYTTTGPGTTMHVAFQLIEQEAKIQWTHVPYPAAKQGLAAVLGGHVTAAVGSTQWVPEVREGSLRLLAVISEQRMKAFPDVPTLRELGYDFAASAGSTIVAPKGTPATVVATFNDAFRKAMDDPDYRQLLRNIYHEPSYRDSEDLKRYLDVANKEFARMVTALKIPTEFDDSGRQR